MNLNIRLFKTYFLTTFFVFSLILFAPPSTESQLELENTIIFNEEPISLNMPHIDLRGFLPQNDQFPITLKSPDILKLSLEKLMASDILINPQLRNSIKIVFDRLKSEIDQLKKLQYNLTQYASIEEYYQFFKKSLDDIAEKNQTLFILILSYIFYMKCNEFPSLQEILLKTEQKNLIYEPKETNIFSKNNILGQALQLTRDIINNKVTLTLPSSSNQSELSITTASSSTQPTQPEEFSRQEEQKLMPTIPQSSMLSTILQPTNIQYTFWMQGPSTLINSLQPLMSNRYKSGLSNFIDKGILNTDLEQAISNIFDTLYRQLNFNNLVFDSVERYIRFNQEFFNELDAKINNFEANSLLIYIFSYAYYVQAQLNREIKDAFLIFNPDIEQYQTTSVDIFNKRNRLNSALRLTKLLLTSTPPLETKKTSETPITSKLPSTVTQLPIPSPPIPSEYSEYSQPSTTPAVSSATPSLQPSLQQTEEVAPEQPPSESPTLTTIPQKPSFPTQTTVSQRLKQIKEQVTTAVINKLAYGKALLRTLKSFSPEQQTTLLSQLSEQLQQPASQQEEMTVSTETEQEQTEPKKETERTDIIIQQLREATFPAPVTTAEPATAPTKMPTTRLQQATEYVKEKYNQVKNFLYNRLFGGGISTPSPIATESSQESPASKVPG